MQGPEGSSGLRGPGESGAWSAHRPSRRPARPRRRLPGPETSGAGAGAGAGAGGARRPGPLRMATSVPLPAPGALVEGGGRVERGVRSAPGPRVGRRERRPRGPTPAAGGTAGRSWSGQRPILALVRPRSPRLFRSGLPGGFGDVY